MQTKVDMVAQAVEQYIADTGYSLPNISSTELAQILIDKIEEYEVRLAERRHEMSQQTTLGENSD